MVKVLVATIRLVVLVAMIIATPIGWVIGIIVTLCAGIVGQYIGVDPVWCVRLTMTIWFVGLTPLSFAVAMVAISKWVERRFPAVHRVIVG